MREGAAVWGLSLPAIGDPPGINSLAKHMTLDPADAFFVAVEQVSFAGAACRIAGEIIASAPPGASRLVPGQLITADAIFLPPFDAGER